MRRDPALCEEVGELLRQLRYQLNLTQDELARQLGVSRLTVMATESGKVDVSMTRLAEYARAAGFTLEVSFRRGPVKLRVARPGSP